ncbi:cyclic nucleotide-binding domain-containing protein [Methylocella sp. CPCC 101449]|jgi:CRP-like cAMP-binding protein|uniref:Crp/Fnr family transcriptional regulator n=1 Tax=Methylocella sp. CPCC 101449 TaxID=2987531 RepID=UPI00288CBD94|nr:cyclic nucleotide-binding domain-containing protein [Methylocella sp. CPCC 101449]MDT2020457.1 cyclic nucleotide-binding domain-containing protein [Methylocella sp. CPCC 101449]HEV2574600.1 cyclic nucleotide-binding domain-containing protein [Beijerinckiaceae bacterium]
MSLEDDIRTLSAVPVFDQMEVEAIRLIAFSGITRNLKADDVLFKAGDPSEGGYLVLSGRVALDQGGSVARHIAGAGTLIGEVALISETECGATATALQPSQVLFVSRALFRRVLGEFPVSANRLKTRMTERLTRTSRDLAQMRGVLEG